MGPLLLSQKVQLKWQFMRTFSFFSNSFLIITCYPNYCKLVVLESFRYHKEKKGNERTFIAPLSDHMETAYDRKRICS